jgi:hypothetical protein
MYIIESVKEYYLPILKNKVIPQLEEYQKKVKIDIKNTEGMISKEFQRYKAKFDSHEFEFLIKQIIQAVQKLVNEKDIPLAFVKKERSQLIDSFKPLGGFSEREKEVEAYIVFVNNIIKKLEK